MFSLLEPTSKISQFLNIPTGLKQLSGSDPRYGGRGFDLLGPSSVAKQPSFTWPDYKWILQQNQSFFSRQRKDARPSEVSKVVSQVFCWDVPLFYKQKISRNTSFLFQSVKAHSE